MTTTRGFADARADAAGGEGRAAVASGRELADAREARGRPDGADSPLGRLEIRVFASRARAGVNDEV